MLNCAICGTGITLSSGVELSETLTQYQICETCYCKKEELLNLQNMDDNVVYFKKHIDSVQNEEIRDYLLCIINTPQRNADNNGAGPTVKEKKARRRVAAARNIGIITLSIGTIAAIFEINNDDPFVMPGVILLFFLAIAGIIIGVAANISSPIHMKKVAKWTIVICILGMVMCCVACTLAAGYR